MFIKFPSKKNLQRVIMKVKGGRLPKSTAESSFLQQNSTCLPITSLKSGPNSPGTITSSNSNLLTLNKQSSQNSQKKLASLFGSQVNGSDEPQFQFELYGSPKATVDVLKSPPNGKNPQKMIISPAVRHHQTTRE